MNVRHFWNAPYYRTMRLRKRFLTSLMDQLTLYQKLMLMENIIFFRNALKITSPFIDIVRFEVIVL
jgi:hypothetical protein